MENPCFISYIRVSTDRQGRSGLGLEAQRTAVANHLNASSGQLLAEYVEVESGKKNNREELARAIEQCRATGAKLIIAKLDRLARNVHFISGLLESGVAFCAADMPNADRFMLHVYAAMAEEEARRISQRTREALKAAKARGVALGTACGALAARNAAEADRAAQKIGPAIAELKDQGLSIRKIADRLNFDKVLTENGGKWHPTSVQRAYQRFRSLP